MTGMQQRKDAIELSEESNWKGLQKLVEEEPLAAHQVDDYGMLPLHWACTEQDVPQGLIYSLLKAYPQAPAVFNKGKLLPLHIAIKAQARVQWIQALISAYPESVLVQTPSGERPLELAEKFDLAEDVLCVLSEAERSFQTLDRDIDEQFASVRSMKLIDGSYNSETHLSFMQDRHGSREGSIGSQRSSGKSIASSDHSSVRYDSGKFEVGSANSSKRRDGYLRTKSGEAPLYPQVSEALSIGSTTSTHQISKPMPQQVARKLSSRIVVSLPPRWTNAPTCHICLAKFSAFKKRHHCRNCGQAICSEHSAKSRIPLPHFGLRDRQRICTVCFEQLSANRYDEAHSESKSFDFGSSLSRVQQKRQYSDSRIPRHVSEPVYDNAPSNWVGMQGQVDSLQSQVQLLLHERRNMMDANRIEDSMSLLNINGKGYQMGSQDPYELRQNKLLEISSNGDNFSGDGKTSTSNDTNETLFMSPFSAGSDSSFSSLSNVNTPDQYRNGLRGFMVPGSHPSDFDPTSVVPSHSQYSAADDKIDERAINSERRSDDFADIDDTEEDAQDSEVDTLVNLGLAMLEKGSCSGAVAAFNRAIEIRPKDAFLYLNLGKALYADDDLDGAVCAIKHSLALHPSAATSTLLGKILFEKGDHDEAIQAYQQSLDIQRDDKSISSC